jgi:Polyketide cyclase / dehydrase and lipid transport
VFDFVADERNEPIYNPDMVRVEKLTPGPIGEGTRYHAVLAGRRRPIEMDLETTTYERPTRLASVTHMAWAAIEGSLSFEPAAGGTRMRWSWDLHPKRFARLIAPIAGWVGRRQERRIWGSLKRHLETSATGSHESEPL